MKPRAAPIATSLSVPTIRKLVDSGGMPEAIRLRTTTARASASAALTGDGMALLLNGGAKRTKPVPRAVPSSSAASVAEATCSCMPASDPAQQVRQHLEQLMGEADQLRQHPVPGDQQRDRDRDHLGHERERGFLDLGGRLEQRDEEAH